MPLGPMLVAKQTLFEELMRAADFHVAFCRVQAEAQALAALFNRRCGPAAPRAWAVSFLDCVVYHVRDARYPGGIVRFLAEQVFPRFQSLLDPNLSPVPTIQTRGARLLVSAASMEVALQRGSFTPGPCVSASTLLRNGTDPAVAL